MSEDEPTRTSGTLPLAIGIVSLEFAAAVTGFVASTLLPIVADDLDARSRLALLLAGSTLGLFVALPMASRVLRRLGTRGTLVVGMFAYLGGLVAAASSAMWILPAMVGPAATLGLAHLVGWRWTLLVPVPFVLFGRLLVVRAVRDDPPDQADSRPLGRTLVIPLGAAGVVLSMNSWPVAIVGAAIAFGGMLTILPAGTARLRPGTPAALGAMVLFAVGYFGADGLITVMLTSGLNLSLAHAAIVLSAAPFCWGLTSLVVSRFTSATNKRLFPALGLSMTALGTAVLTIQLAVGGSFPVALAAWAIGGIGVGLAYPGLYVRAATAGSSGFTAAELAAAVITAECTGQLLGRAIGGTLSSAGDNGGLFASYLLFAAALLAAAAAGRPSNI